jgi:SP family arabinose:H+ symporter-like MFS transporter
MLVNAAGSVLTFCIYAAMCALSIILTLRFVPETKGRSLEEIEAQWCSSSTPRGFPLDR